MADVGDDMYALARELYPICRSITGNGVRATLEKIKSQVPIEIHEVPTGTPLFDWVVPREWNIHDAYVKDEHGRRVIDFQECNLHVVSYSVPVHQRMPLRELETHLFSLPDHPEWVPYRTSYYKESWGFCLSERQRAQLTEQMYEVCIDATLEDGHLTYGEYIAGGESGDEVLLSAHVCHPSLCNDNLSGISLLTTLAKHLEQISHKYSYRFVFAPGTIGSLAWLARNEANLARVKHGLVIACVGDMGGPNYKRSRRGDAPVDRAVEHVFAHGDKKGIIRDFSPYGYDERQYCSPGFDLPVGLLQRSHHGEFPEYHTSADNLDFVRPECLEQSFEILIRVLDVLENDARYRNLSPKGEPQLGSRGLYDSIGGDKDRAAKQMALLWVLNQSDGSRSLLDIAERASLPFGTVHQAARRLLESGLLEQCD